MPKPKQFHYEPRFYDERKERLEKMKERAEAEFAAKKDGAPYSRLERGFLSEMRAKSKLQRKSPEKGSAIRYLIILAAILGFLYLLMPELFIAFWTGK